MNRLKSIFISLSITIWAYFSLLFVQEIITNGLSIFSLGIFAISVVPVSFFAILLITKPIARTSKSLPLITLIIIAGAVISLWAVNQSHLSIQFQYSAILSVILWLTYVNWYSAMPQSLSMIKIGDQLPVLKFIDNNKNEITNTDFIDKKMLYLFYRGNWCPLCMAQIKEISEEYKELEKRGVEVLLISPQPVSHSANLAKKMGVNFHFLTDVNNQMARKLKIGHKNGTPLGMEIFGYTSETVLPTVIITDDKHKVLYFDQTDNYRIRPEPSTFIKVIDNIENGNKSHEA